MNPAPPAMQVPLLDLKSQYAPLRGQVMEAFGKILDSQFMINGPAVAEFEKAVAAFCGCRDAVGVSSGTDALILSLMALGIGPGDEVITSPFTFFATAGSIVRTGATPVFIDIDPVTFNLDPVHLEKALTPRTKALMPVHLFGQMADMDPMLAFAKKHGLAVVEDACQTIGSTYRGRQAGTLGTTGCFSFFPSKNLGGAGDAGMVVTQDEELGKTLRIYRNHGMDPKYYHHAVGGNFRIDTLQAAYLLIKLPHLSHWAEGRRRNAAMYRKLLGDVKQIRLPEVAEGRDSTFNQFTIRTARRDELRACLTQAGIGNEVYYPLCLHQQKCFAHLKYPAGGYPQAEKAAREVLSIPIYPELTGEQIEYVAKTIREFFA